MLNHDDDVDNELSLQDSLLTAPNPTVKAETSPTLKKSQSSIEGSISSSSSALHVSNDYWGWELFGVLGSAAILIGIAIILNKFDGKRQPSWEHVSLNSLLSWLSTAAKFCILVPITRSLGQLKWVWFAEKERPLSDLEEFDSASRGISGSAKLLWRLKGLHFAAVGSLAIILASGLDPFAQNLIHYYPNAVSDPFQPAYLANASTYTAVGSLIGGDLYDVNQNLKANVYNAILNPESQVWAQPQYVCNTGNCTWEPVASIGICASCSDISADLTMSCKRLEPSDDEGNYRNCTVSLPNGFATWFVDGGLHGCPMIIGNSNDNFSPLVYKKNILPIIQGIKAVNNDTNPYTNQYAGIELTAETPFIATECALVPCVRSVQASVRKSVYNESTPIYWFEREATNRNSDWWVTMNPPWGPDLGVQEGQSFGIGFEALDALVVFIRSLLSGAVWVVSDSLILDASKADIIAAIFYGDFADCDNPLDKISCAVNNVAQAISKTFWDTPYINSGIEDTHMAIGETFVSLTFVRIQWGWLAFPIAIWVLSVITLLGTVWRTRRAQVQTWRNSPLPLVFLHLHEDDEVTRSYETSNAGFSTRADKLYIKLNTEEGDIQQL
ncbi:hypothetical protein GGI35DRAFT_482692 [Trichoderma velutinum]